MGSGKSIIGKDLSNSLNLKFYDTDKEIELKTKKSINSIFKDNGEPYFRKIEEKICLELLKNNNCVISLGGGSIINNKIRKSIEKYSYSIYLNVKFDNLLSRLKLSHRRPLIDKSTDKRKTLENLYKDRQRFYEKADFIVNNDGNKFQVLNKIKSQLNSYERKFIHKK